MKTAIACLLTAAGTVVFIAIIKNVRAADGVPLLGAGIVKMRSLL